MIYRDRVEAGQLLANELANSKSLQELRKGRDLMVLAIPRGGVTVGAEVARRLRAPLDVWLARKVGAPGNPEFAIASVSANGELLVDRATIAALGIPRGYVEEEAHRQSEELTRRMMAYRGHTEPVEVSGKIVILVDDGIATGSTALSALASLRRAGAAARILAVPVAPSSVVPVLEAAADLVIVLHTATEFASVGQFYVSFDQVSDEEVVQILSEHFGMQNS